MKKYVYGDKYTRAKVTYSKYFKKFTLQIQEKVIFLWFFRFWCNTGNWMTTSEGFWGESNMRQTLTVRYETGQPHISYMTGTFDLKKVATEFLEAHKAILAKDRENEKRMMKLLEP
jgi:hypothetical protein